MFNHRSVVFALVLVTLSAATASAQSIQRTPPQLDAVPIGTAGMPLDPRLRIGAFPAQPAPFAPLALRQAATGPRASELIPIRYGRGIRRTILMGLTGAAAGAFAGGVMELLDPHGEIADIWPVLLAIPGFAGGVVFSVVVPAGPEQ